MDQDVGESIKGPGQLSSGDDPGSSNSDTPTAHLKVEGEENKCSSHVIDIKCDGYFGENQRVCRICHLDAKESGMTCNQLIELGCGCKGELAVAHLHCAEAWFKLRGNSSALLRDSENLAMDEWFDARKRYAGCKFL